VYSFCPIYYVEDAAMDNIDRRMHLDSEKRRLRATQAERKRLRDIEKKRILAEQEQASIQAAAIKFFNNTIKRADARLAAYHKRRIDRIASYGITLDQYEAMLSSQGGVCAICSQSRPLHIDHCHKTGRVRGLLCSHCNTTLGHMQDNPDFLINATYYLLANKYV
jgi:hypothetical protein